MREQKRLASDLAATAVSRREPDRALVVGVTGVEGSGAHQLAMQIEEQLSLLGETPVLVALSDFQRSEQDWLPDEPQNEPIAYYEEGFDLAALVSGLLEPVRRGEPVELVHAGQYGEHTFVVEPADVVVLSGPFLMRSALRTFVDFLIYVEASNKAVLQQARARGESEEAYRLRYLPASLMHAATHPAVEHADIVVDFEAPSAPRVVWRR